MRTNANSFFHACRRQARSPALSSHQHSIESREQQVAQKQRHTLHQSASDNVKAEFQ
jgi:hypothetical protein